MSSKLRVLNRITESGLVAILRAEVSERVVQVVDACVEGGVSVVEVTFTVPDAARVLEDLTHRYRPEDLTIGAGTVLDPETARIAILAGAQFVVSPSLNPETARLCNRYQIPHLPGAGTVREIIAAMESGADIVKIFPSETLGPAFVKAVRSPLPQASLMPTGGVSLDNAAEWIKAGCVAIGVSGHLTGSAKTGDFRLVTDLAKRFFEEIRRARA